MRVSLKQQHLLFRDSEWFLFLDLGKISSKVSAQKLSTGNGDFCGVTGPADSLRKDVREASFGEGGEKCKILLTSGITKLPQWDMERLPGSKNSSSESLEIDEKEEAEL